MFYDKFVYLCKQKGVSPSRAAVEAGISKSLVTKWRTNKVRYPSADIAEKVAIYFNISVSDLLDDEYRSRFTAFPNGITAYSFDLNQDPDAVLSDLEPGSFRIVFRSPGIIIVVDNNSCATTEQINSVVSIYNGGEERQRNQPTVSDGLSLADVSEEDIRTIKAYLEMPEDQRRALAKILGVSE